eukprot:COSAG02_NODE_3874_length_6107_cov_7.362350_4_plen_47_part_00
MGAGECLQTPKRRRVGGSLHGDSSAFLTDLSDQVSSLEGVVRNFGA